MKRALVALACCLAGCASEPPRIPPDVSRSNAAVVRAWSPAEGEVRIVSIDGIEIGKVSHVYLAPGEHQITMRWTGAQAVTRIGQIRAVVQSRSTYVVEAEPDGALRTVRFSLVDKGPGYDEQCLQEPLLGGQPRGRGC